MKTQMPLEDVLYTIPEVAKLLKCSTGYAYSLVRNGLLPALKLGNLKVRKQALLDFNLKVRKQALLDFLERNEGNDLTDPANIVPIKDQTA